MYLSYILTVTVNPNSSNTDGSFTVPNSNSFLSPYEILPIAQENKYLGIFFLFYHEIVCCVYSLESPHCCVENQNYFIKLSLFASWLGSMINPQWLELHMSRTIFYGPKDVRAIEVRPYFLSLRKAVFCHCGLFFNNVSFLADADIAYTINIGTHLLLTIHL